MSFEDSQPLAYIAIQNRNVSNFKRLQTISLCKKLEIIVAFELFSNIKKEKQEQINSFVLQTKCPLFYGYLNNKNIDCSQVFLTSFQFHFTIFILVLRLSFHS